MSNEQSIGQTIKDSFMSLGHGAPGKVDTQSGGNSRLHPASDKLDTQDQPGLRDHGSGKNGPKADFRALGTKYENVRKEGQNPTPNAEGHGVDGLLQHNAK